MLAITAAGCSSHMTRHASSTTTTTTTITTNNGKVTTTPSSAPGITADELNAHLGVGVPAGWVPVDEGNARVWVPKDWFLAQRGTCFTDTSDPGVVSIGGLPSTSCDSPGHVPILNQEVALIPTTQKPIGRQSHTVHGYRIYAGNPRLYDSPVNAVVYVVPQLGIEIIERGTLSARVLDTLAPSARKVALAFAVEGVPTNWHAVTDNTTSMSIPPTWRVETPSSYGCSWLSAYGGSPQLWLIKPNIEVPPCPPPSAFRSVDALHDGVYLYLPAHNSFAPSPTGQPIARLHHGTTMITIYPEQTDPNALDLYVHKAGSSITHVLTVGLGRDGRIAGGVLASLRAES